MNEMPRLICRTCLTTDADFYKLDEDLLECITHYTRLSDVPEFPKFICVNCDESLKAAHQFVCTAIEAHKTLQQQQLLPADSSSHNHHDQMPGSVEDAPLQLEETPKRGVDAAAVGVGVVPEHRPMRYRCKICGDKVETKKCLKEHVKLHMDIISYSCQLCPFACKKRSQLSEHYNTGHGIEPQPEQLKLNISIAKRNGPDNAAADGQVNAMPPQPTQQQVNINEWLESTSANVYADGAVDEILPCAEVNVPGMPNGIIVEYMHTTTNSGNMAVDSSIEPTTTTTTTAPLVASALDNIYYVDDNNIIEMQEEPEVLPPTSMPNNTDFEDIMPANKIENKVAVKAKKAVPIVKTVSATPKIKYPKYVKCKMCAQYFDTKEMLKTHMLSHNEIPHFFCVECPFYTFFKVDLTQHYKTLHRRQPTQKQLQPKNKLRVGETAPPAPSAPLVVVDSRGEMEKCYSCDMCLFETTSRIYLRRHYFGKHQVNATEVQLRPIIDEHTIVLPVTLTPSNVNVAAQAEQTEEERPANNIKPDYPNGLNCNKCNRTFYWRNKLAEHLKRHNHYDESILDCDSADATEMREMNEVLPNEMCTEFLKINNNSNNNNNNNNDDSVMPNVVIITNPDVVDVTAQTTAIQMTTTTTAEAEPTPTTTAETAAAAAAAAVGSCISLPLDAIPQVVEMDIIENGMDFDFNCETIFDGFDDDDDGEECRNGTASDADDTHELLLTSDDEDFAKLLDAEPDGGGILQQAYCPLCNRKFQSQYQFENHMFIHRGLAPYRCELCTNLYNRKRALIRHYRAVHKRLPTRDMIQAKGDKVCHDAEFPLQHFNLESEQKPTTFMCAKCPYESAECLLNMQVHLRNSHGIADDSYILQKLPFECTRCIRSFATLERLLSHLECNHSAVAIIRSSSSTESQQSTVAATSSTAFALNSTQTLDMPSSSAAAARASICTVVNVAHPRPPTCESPHKKLRMLLSDLI